MPENLPTKSTNKTTCTIKLDKTPWFRVICSDDKKFRIAINGIRAIPNGDTLYATWNKTWLCRIEHLQLIKEIVTQLYDEVWIEADVKRELIKKVQAPPFERVEPEQMSLFG